MPRNTLLFLSIALTLLGASGTAAHQTGVRASPLNGRRVALVIGNSAYQRRPIPNAMLDAKATKEVLQKLNFDVTWATDVTRKRLAESIDEFVARLQPNDVALFYYSGLGIGLGGENYLVGTDFAGGDKYDIQYDGYPLGRIQERIERSGTAMSILILEACHNNPFSDTKTVSRGLTAETVARGTFLAFASEPGTLSVDVGAASNSLFTARLLEVLNQPGLTLDEVFNRVRADVVLQTNGKQVPIQLSSMTGSFYFIPPPGSAERAFDQGLQLLKEKRAREAISYFDHAVGTNPAYIASYVRRAEALRLLGDDKRAQADLEQAIRLKPTDSTAYLHQALAYVWEFRFERALADLNYSIKLEANMDHAYELRAGVLDHLGDWEGAILDYDEAIRRTPNVPHLYRARGIDRLKVGAYSLAADDLTKVASSEPDAEVYLSRSLAYSHLKRSDLALADLNSASKLSSVDFQKCFNMGNSFLEIGDLDLAEKEFRLALEINPNDDVVLNALGYTLADRGIKLPEALSFIQRAVQLDQNNWAYLDSLGWVYYRLRQMDRAEKYLKMSLDLHTTPEQLEHLGDVYSSEERKADAVNEWKEALAMLERRKTLVVRPADSARDESNPATLEFRLRSKLSDISEGGHIENLPALLDKQTERSTVRLNV